MCVLLPASANERKQFPASFFREVMRGRMLKNYRRGIRIKEAWNNLL